MTSSGSPGEPLSTAPQVLVVGAGPTGLVLALSLARAGVGVRVVDQRPGIGQESRALDVQARTLELYRMLGLADRLVERGTRIARLAIRQGGRAVTTTDVSGFGEGLSPFPFLLCCPQDDHERLLVEELAAAGVQVERRTELVTLRQHPDGVSVVLRSPTGDEELTVAFVGGCDGSSSTVRQQLGVDYRGRTTDRHYFVADVAARGEPAPPPERGAGGLFSFCLSRDDFMLVVPARSTGSHRVIGLLPRELPGAETDFEDLRPVVERTTDMRIDHVSWFSTYRVSHRVADRFRVGRTFLLGDAAHVHSPLGGQGMNTGIADAVNLAWKLAAVVQGRSDAALLDTYQVERIGFARSLVHTTDRLFGLVAGSGVRQRTARNVLFRGALPVLLRFPRSRRSLIGRVSQVDVRYRRSPLSSGVAGRVRGGDRLPWVELGDGEDNFQTLATRDWQVHVYGEATTELAERAEHLGLPVHQLPWSDAAARAGLRRDACYLVRPDGYVALADPRQSPLRVAEVFGRFGRQAEARPAFRAR